jgi:4-hydroxy-tetrahydrodipicolinate synthase
MVTPYDEALRIDRGAYRALVDWYLAHDVGGLYANCLTSEMYLLSDEERLLLVIEAVSIARGRTPIAATGNFGETAAEQIAFCRRVADAGADVVMLVIPEFLNSDAELERYFLEAAQQVDAPLGLYECPVPRPYHLSMKLVERLARTGRFVAFKETSEDLRKIVALQRVTQGTPLALLQANTPYLLDATRAGVPGTMSIAATWLPDLVAAVITRARADDPTAERLQGELCIMAMIFVSAIGSRGDRHQVRLRLGLGAWLGWPTWQVHPLQHPIKERPWLGAKEPFGSGRAITALHKVIVHRRQGGQLPIAQAMQAMMAESQLPIAPFDTGTGALE